MELITYPFSLFMGAAFVLFLLAPTAVLSYILTQCWCEWLTDEKYKLRLLSVDKIIRNDTVEILLVVGGLVSVLIAVWSLGHWDHEAADALYLDSLIRVTFGLPVKLFAWLSPVLFPVVVLLSASFGMRKLFRVGYNISDRLKKVEDK